MFGVGGLQGILEEHAETAEGRSYWIDPNYHVSTSEFDPDFVEAEGDVDAIDRWPYVTRTEVIGDVPAREGVGLDVIGKNGQSMQSGLISISRDQFEELAKGLMG